MNWTAYFIYRLSSGTDESNIWCMNVALAPDPGLIFLNPPTCPSTTRGLAWMTGSWRAVLSGRPKAEAWGAWRGGWALGQCYYSGDEDCMNDLRKSWGQQECSPAGRTHGISLYSRVITPALPNNSRPEQSIIKKKPAEGFSLQADAERGTVTCMQTYHSCS